MVGAAEGTTFSYLESLGFRSPTLEEAHFYRHPLDCAYMHTLCS